MKVYSKNVSVFVLLFLAAMAGCNEEEITPRNELVAMAGNDKTIKVNEEILLDGSGSYDKSSKPFTYLWSVKTKPQGSVASLGTNTTVKTTFAADVPGLYIIQLMITQNQFTAIDELVITATSTEPNGPITVILSESITTNRTLVNIVEDPSQPDYLVTNDIEVRADLIIMPGVTIVFEENKGLQVVSGSILARGNADHGIVFKGLGDRPGYWKGILILSNSDVNEFEYVTVKQAGSIAFAESEKVANVILGGSSISGASLKIRHSVFSDGGGYGLYVQGMSSLNQFSNNAFLNNTSAAAYIPARQLHKIDAVSFTGDSRPTELETGGVMSEESEVTWKKLVSGSYLVTSDILISGGVAIEPGASFKMSAGVTIQVAGNGYLNASGSNLLGITFTSRATNVHWNGLFFNSANQHNKMKYCEVSNAGLNRIADAAHPANIVVGSDGSVTVENSVIKNGLGYGVVAKSIGQLNDNVSQMNTFENLQKGTVFPVIVNEPEKPAVTGVWLDKWSFNQRRNNVTDGFYSKETGVWFGGAANPWAMEPAGFGIRIGENGNFIWTIAEHSPMTGCESYSAEYITGIVTVSAGTISFNQDYWRSKFINSCDVSQNVDIDVSTSVIELPYQINRMHNVFTMEEYWELKFTNPDGSTFSFYRR